MFTIFMIVVPITSSKALQPDIPKSERTRVMVQNKNDYLLGVHCLSRDDDIGLKFLKKVRYITGVLVLLS